MRQPAADIATDLFYGSEKFQADTKRIVERRFGIGANGRPPIVTARAFASSGDLVKDSVTIEEWRLRSRDVAAVEMELPGVYAAARRNDREYPVLAIRGISDVVGFSRSHEWTTYATHTAAAFAYALIQTDLMSQIVLPREQRSQNQHGQPLHDGRSQSAVRGLVAGAAHELMLLVAPLTRDVGDYFYATDLPPNEQHRSLIERIGCVAEKVEVNRLFFRLNTVSAAKSLCQCLRETVSDIDVWNAKIKSVSSDASLATQGKYAQRARYAQDVGRLQDELVSALRAEIGL